MLEPEKSIWKVLKRNDFDYAALSGRTLSAPLLFPHRRCIWKTTCPLTREEAVYAMATVLALNGIAVVEDGERFVQVVPMRQRAHLTARAPQPDPNATLLDPTNVPSMGNYNLPKVAMKMERDLQRLQKPPDRSAQRLLEFYASLVGKTSEPSKNRRYAHLVP